MLRVGMSVVIERYPHLDANDPAQANFVWFMSAAEAKVLADEFQMSNPPALARVMLDNTIVLSQAAGQSGRIGLHAARSGGNGLLAVYVKSGLTRLPATAPFPPAITRPNDGRFFFASELTAELLAKMLDPSR
jgi:hypothetical protein